jgi:hypothetical protein
MLHNGARIVALCMLALIAPLLVYACFRRPTIWVAPTRPQGVKAVWSILVGPGTGKALSLTLRSLYDNVLVYHPRPVLLFYVRRRSPAVLSLTTAAVRRCQFHMSHLPEHSWRDTVLLHTMKFYGRVLFRLTDARTDVAVRINGSFHGRPQLQVLWNMAGGRCQEPVLHPLMIGPVSQHRHSRCQLSWSLGTGWTPQP